MADAAFEALWKNVLDRWDEERAHGAFLEHCQVSDQLAEAAARYRGMKGDRERGAIAEKRLAGLRSLRSPSSKPREVGRATPVHGPLQCCWRPRAQSQRSGSWCTCCSRGDGR